MKSNSRSKSASFLLLSFRSTISTVYSPKMRSPEALELFTCAFEHFKCSTTSPNVTFSIIVFPDLSFTSYRFETTVFASSQCPARNVFIILAFHSGTSLVFHFAHQSSSSTMRPMRSQKPLLFSLQVSHICSSLFIFLNVLSSHLHWQESCFVQQM